MSKAYYNEHDVKAAAWLSELIRAGHIADGDVDTRSIEDVTPTDLAGYTQCHFFAGIGGWSYALRQAGVPDSTSVWTGSCPCQPFSTGGKGGGFDDERHLWPSFDWLIAQRRPSIVYGEQVASASGRAWFDLVSTDLEGKAYACAAFDIPASGVGSPQLRQRLYWVAHAHDAGSQGRGGAQCADQWADRQAPPRGAAGGLGNAELPQEERQRQHGWEALPEHESRLLGPTSAPSVMADAHLQLQRPAGNTAGASDAGRVVKINFWSACDWLPCRDGKARPVEPGTSPLADGVPGRVGLLRGYGNAIVPWVAVEFIKATWR